MIIHLFGYPGPIGGASTKLCDFITEFHDDYKIINYLPVLPSDSLRTFLSNHGVMACSYDQFPARPGGVCLGVCLPDFFTLGIPERCEHVGIPVLWSNEMMWLFPGEAAAAKNGLITKALFLSEIQRVALESTYSDVPSFIIGNYVNPNRFHYCRRPSNRRFSIGRLSRADPLKYPINFPTLYESLVGKDELLKVQAWGEELSKAYSWHSFDPTRWILNSPNQENPERFLQSIDVFAYPLGHRFVEIWGRSTVEAMLTGSVPLVPSGHHQDQIVVNGVNGYICRNDEEFVSNSKLLYDDRLHLSNLSLSTAEYARDVLCNKAQMRELWKQVLEETA